MHPSSLTKCTTLRFNDETILEEFLLDIVSQAIEKGLIKSKTFIIDTTHTRTQYSVQTPIEMLRNVSKTIHKQLYRYVPLIPPKLHAITSLKKLSGPSIHRSIRFKKHRPWLCNLLWMNLLKNIHRTLYFRLLCCPKDIMVYIYSFQNHKNKENGSF